MALRTVSISHPLYYFSFMKLTSFAHMKPKVIVSSVWGLTSNSCVIKILIFITLSLHLLLVLASYRLLFG